MEKKMITYTLSLLLLAFSFSTTPVQVEQKEEIKQEKTKKFRNFINHDATDYNNWLAGTNEIGTSPSPDSNPKASHTQRTLEVKKALLWAWMPDTENWAPSAPNSTGDWLLKSRRYRTKEIDCKGVIPITQRAA